MNPPGRTAVDLGDPVLPWRLLGLGGTALFGGRWLVQVYASRRARRPVINPAFWAMSLAGSLLLLTYFALGPNRDLVGIASNLFPLGIASYNLSLALRKAETTYRKQGRDPAG